MTKKTPLYDQHVALGAKIVDFAGWAMPIYYSSIIAEHQQVRKSCGVFDVSHLGELHVKGPKAFDFLQQRLTNDLRKLKNGKILYSLLCNEGGFTLDDILIYQAQADDFYLIVNAGNIDSDLEAIKATAPDSVTITNRSDEMACIAVQGPTSAGILERLFGFALTSLGYYAFQEEKFEGEAVWVSRSGYTGEDGFEIFLPPGPSISCWQKLMQAGEQEGLKPAGLGARNTLRLEAGNALYGHELDSTTTPLEAGLGWAVSFQKGAFVGSGKLLEQKEAGLTRRLVGFKMLDRSIPRENYTLFQDGKTIGRVTSGSFGPSVGIGIGFGYVEEGNQAPGNRIQVGIHGKMSEAEVVKPPFVPLRRRK